MLRSVFFALAPFSVAHAAVPFDMPRELMQDVNKGPYPTVNIIADADNDSEGYETLVATRRSSTASRKQSFLKSSAAGLESKLAAQFPGESAAFIRSLVMEGLSQAAQVQGLSASDISCSRNYAGCPNNYVDSGNGICAPAFNYGGRCGSIDVSGLTPMEKASVARSCGVEFPCMAAGSSFLMMLPPGVASGIAANQMQNQDVTLALSAPEEDADAVNQQIDSLLKVEQMHEKATDSDYIASKQRLLNAEMAKVHDIVGRSSFAQTTSSDYQINMHEASESASDIAAKMNSLARVESAKQAAANSDFLQQKRNLMQAEMQQIRRMTR